MLLAIMGSAGLGLVWGWLGGSLLNHERSTYRAVLAFVLASTTVLIGVRWLSGWREVGYFLCVAAFSLLLHAAWYQELRRIIESSNSE